MDENSAREKYADLEWAQPGWLLQARAWIEQHARITGELEQVHLRPWSTVLRVPTADGDLFFKAASISGAFEPALIDKFMQREPATIPQTPYADYDTMLGALEAQLSKGPYLLGQRMTAAGYGRLAASHAEAAAA